MVGMTVGTNGQQVAGWVCV